MLVLVLLVLLVLLLVPTPPPRPPPPRPSQRALLATHQRVAVHSEVVPVSGCVGGVSARGATNGDCGAELVTTMVLVMATGLTMLPEDRGTRRPWLPVWSSPRPHPAPHHTTPPHATPPHVHEVTPEAELTGQRAPQPATPDIEIFAHVRELPKLGGHGAGQRVGDHVQISAKREVEGQRGHRCRCHLPNSREVCEVAKLGLSVCECV